MPMSKRTTDAFLALELCGTVNALARQLAADIAASQPKQPETEVPSAD